MCLPIITFQINIFLCNDLDKFGPATLNIFQHKEKVQCQMTAGLSLSVDSVSLKL